MGFADFSGANFSITSVGVGVGAFGYEWSKFRFLRFLEGKPVPGGISVGGLSFGGIEANLGSVVYGTMFLTDNPSETYVERTRSTVPGMTRSEGEETSAHRVFFATGSAKIAGLESQLLDEYLHDVVAQGL
jgi:hypothetical protein